MNERDWLAERFEAHRGRLRAAAYRMLGSLPDADDAVQEARLRLVQAPSSEVVNLRAWLTTVVARVCLTRLRSRLSRRGSSHEPQPDRLVTDEDGVYPDPEEALRGDSVRLALLVVLDTLTPAERIAFVLHDVFAVPFDQIAPIVNRTPVAARQLAADARRRIRGSRSSGHTSTAGRVYRT